MVSNNDGPKAPAKETESSRNVSHIDSVLWLAVLARQGQVG